jgi:hypothetical protein
LEKLSVTFSVNRSSPPEPPVEMELINTTSILLLKILYRLLTGFPNHQCRVFEMFAGAACKGKLRRGLIYPFRERQIMNVDFPGSRAASGMSRRIEEPITGV